MEEEVRNIFKVNSDNRPPKQYRVLELKDYK